MPMQPFAQPAPVLRRPELPRYLKAILVTKLLACLGWMALSFLLVFAGSSSNEPIAGTTAEGMHAAAKLAMIIMATALVELFGIAGTWSFKRWGVYVLAGCSMLSFVLGVKSGQAFGFFSIATMMAAGFAILTRWKDFE